MFKKTKHHQKISWYGVILFTILITSYAWGGETQREAKVKHIIILIADGLGFNQLKATEYWNGKKQGYETWEVHFPVSTYPYGSEYDTNHIWAKFKNPKSDSTDSAAAATAMATGVKTYRGAIGMDIQKKSLKNLIERAESLGMATGVVTSENWTGATPASFVTHNADRGHYVAIAKEMIYHSGVDVIMGAGHPAYDDKGKRRRRVKQKQYKSVGGKDTWDEIVAGTAGGDADGDGIPDPWTLIQTQEEFQHLMQGVTPKRVLGVAQVAKTLQMGRVGGWRLLKSKIFQSNQPPYTIPFIPTVPTLAEMSLTALNILDNDPDGFFLMIEGASIDHASHSNYLGLMIEEQNAFNHTVQTVIDWVEIHSNWEETLVIVTSDHETGYLWGRGSRRKTFNPIVDNGPGKMPGYKYYSWGHSNVLVPLFAKGIGSDRFQSYATNVDVKMGPYIDNTNIAHLIFGLYDELND